MPRAWLLKTEPDVFSFADLMARPGRVEPWEGVRNYTARNNLQAMEVGDPLLIYHSRCEPPHVVGIAEVARAAYPDPAAWDPTHPYFDAKTNPANPRWFRVDVRGLRPLARTVSLAELKSDPELAGLELLRQSRLSVSPVTAAQWQRILTLGGG